MTTDSLLLDIDVNAGVATVTLNKPEVHNAFDEQVIAKADEALTTLRGRDDVHVVVLRGAGKSFSAGADMNWMKKAAAYTETQNKEDALKLAQMLHNLYTLPQLTIACVQGAAIGGGFGLVACCDLVIADVNTVFALAEVKLGLVPATIGPYVMAAIGPRQARRYFQTGERFKGDTAQKIGLVHEVVEGSAAMEARLDSLLEVVKTNGPQAMATSKQLCMDLAYQPITTDTLESTAACIAQARTNEEAQEGLAAFLEKRKARWVRD